MRTYPSIPPISKHDHCHLRPTPPGRTATTPASSKPSAKSKQNAPGDTNLTLVPHQTAPIADFPELTARTFVPRGSTSLLDAVGKTIQATGERLAALPETGRPGHVVVAIFTDGRENASTIYSPQKINKMISHQREVYSWEFIFLAANQDTIGTAARMGIGAHAAATIDHSDLGTTAASAALSKSILESRKQSFFDGKVCEYQKASMLEHYEDSHGRSSLRVTFCNLSPQSSIPKPYPPGSKVVCSHATPIPIPILCDREWEPGDFEFPGGFLTEGQTYYVTRSSTTSSTV